MGPPAPERPGTLLRARGFAPPLGPSAALQPRGLSQRPSGLPLAHPGTCPPGLSPCPPQTPRDPASLGSQPCGAKTPRRGSFPRVLTVLSSGLAEPGWAVAQLNSLPAPRGTLSSPLLSSLSGRAPLSLQVYALPTVLWFCFLLNVRSGVFHLKQSSEHTLLHALPVFCTLFLWVLCSSLTCPWSQTTWRRPQWSVLWNRPHRTPSHRKTGGDQLPFPGR